MEEWLANNYPTILIIIAGGGLIFGIGKWYGVVNSDRASFQKFMGEVRDDIKQILRRLPETAVSSKSPVSLTDFGENISNHLGVARWAVDHALQLRTLALGKEEYQIYDLCVDYVGKQIERDEDLKNTMRAGAYQLGTDLENIRKVYEVELRDELLRKIKE